jgi:hypothetical protein
MELRECSETSAYKIQTPGKYPEESIQLSLSPSAVFKAQLVFSAPSKENYLSETDLSLLLNVHEEEFGAIFKILMAQYHVYPSSSVILAKKRTCIGVQYATNMQYVLPRLSC